MVLITYYSGLSGLFNKSVLIYPDSHKKICPKLRNLSNTALTLFPVIIRIFVLFGQQIRELVLS